MEIPKWWQSKNWVTDRIWSFNPSSDGNPKVVLNGSCRFEFWFMFQSFFWWKSQSGKDTTDDSNTNHVVSILLLMEIPKWFSRKCPVCAMRWSFNPSSDGNPKVVVTLNTRNWYMTFVSILLLMEIPKWSYWIVGFLFINLLFQSFFWWKSQSGLWTPRYLAGTQIRFQSFFWWKSQSGVTFSVASKMSPSGFNPSSDGNPKVVRELVVSS